jgi:hypothetical protein
LQNLLIRLVPEKIRLVPEKIRLVPEKIRLVPETMRSKKKVGFIFHRSFLYSRIRDENFWDPDLGSGMKNLGIQIRVPG